MSKRPRGMITRRPEAQRERALALPPGEDYGEAGLDLQVDLLASRVRPARRKRVKRAKIKRKTPR